MRASRYGSFAIRSMLYAAVCCGIVFVAIPASGTQQGIFEARTDVEALFEPRRKERLVRRLRPTDPEAEDRMLA